MKETVSVKRLQSFLMNASGWLNSNPNNVKLEVASCIMRFVTDNKEHIIMSPQQLPNGGQGIAFFLKAQSSFGEKSFKLKREAKIKHADIIKVSEISNKPGNDVTEYSFTATGKNNYQEMLKECEDIDKQIQKENHDFMNGDIDITPVYASKVPSHTELPTDVLKTFIGFVVADTEKLGVIRDLTPKGNA